jgi:hypothetical protein
LSYTRGIELVLLASSNTLAVIVEVARTIGQ